MRLSYCIINNSIVHYTRAAIVGGTRRFKPGFQSSNPRFWIVRTNPRSPNTRATNGIRWIFHVLDHPNPSVGRVDDDCPIPHRIIFHGVRVAQIFGGLVIFSCSGCRVALAEAIDIPMPARNNGSSKEQKKHNRHCNHGSRGAAPLGRRCVCPPLRCRCMTSQNSRTSAYIGFSSRLHTFSR